MKTLFIVASILTSTLIIADPVNLLKPTNKEDSWRLEQAGEAKAEMKIEDDSVVFRTTAIDSTDWHVQAVQTNLDLKDGKTYQIKFKAKSPEEVGVTVNAMIDQEDWHQGLFPLGLRSALALQPWDPCAALGHQKLIGYSFDDSPLFT